MSARSQREVLTVVPGKDVSIEVAKAAQGDHEFQVETYYLDGELSGGMTFPLSFDIEEVSCGQSLSVTGVGGEKTTFVGSVASQPSTMEDIVKIFGQRTTRYSVVAFVPYVWNSLCPTKHKHTDPYRSRLPRAYGCDVN